MKKVLVTVAIVLLLPAGLAHAGPAEDLSAAAQFAREGNKQAATPLLNGIVADESAPPTVKAQAYFVLAALQSNAADAVPYLDKAVAADPSFFKGHERRALKLSEAGKHAEATLAAEEALKLQPNDKQMLRLKADSFYRAGDYPRAATAYGDMLKTDNRNGSLLILRGHSYLLSRQHDKALADFNTAQRYLSRLDPEEQANLHYYRGMAYQDADRFDLAVDAFTRALAMNPRTERKAEVERLLADTTARKEAFEAMAQTRKSLSSAQELIRRRNSRAAVPLLEGVLNNAHVTDELKAQANYLMALTRQNDAAALPDVDKAVILAPQNTAYLDFQGSLRYAAGDFKGAIASFERSLALAPSNLDAIIMTGKSHLNLGDWDAAEKSFTKGLELDADNHVCFANRARANVMLGNTDQAGADIQKAAPGVRRMQKSDTAEYYYVLGLLAQHDKKYDEALRNYSRALGSDASGTRGRDLQHRKQQLESLRRWS